MPIIFLHFLYLSNYLSFLVYLYLFTVCECCTFRSGELELRKYWKTLVHSNSQTRFTLKQLKGPPGSFYFVLIKISLIFFINLIHSTYVYTIQSKRGNRTGPGGFLWMLRIERIFVLKIFLFRKFLISTNKYDQTFFVIVLKVERCLQSILKSMWHRTCKKM